MASPARFSRASRLLAVGIATTTLVVPTHAQAVPASPPRDSIRLMSTAFAGGPGDDDSVGASLSADGKLVLFDSRASNLTEVRERGDADYDLFLHDRATGSHERITYSRSGGEPNSDCYGSAMSGDGMRAAFVSRATNLVSDKLDGEVQVFYIDLGTGETTLVTKGVDGKGGNNLSQYPEISGDGQYVVFSSEASNLVAGDDNGTSDVFVWDAVSERTTLVSVNLQGETANGWSGNPTVTTDGSVIAFDSYATDLTDDEVEDTSHVFLRSKGATELVVRDRRGRPVEASNPEISEDGGYVGFTSIHAFTRRDQNDAADAHLLDVRSGVVELLSTRPDGKSGNSESVVEAVSARGRSVTFGSNANDLVPGDDNTSYDVFVRNRGGEVRLVSRSMDGTPSEFGGSGSAMDRKGKVVAFTSNSTDIDPEDDSTYADVFLYRQPRAS